MENRAKIDTIIDIKWLSLLFNHNLALTFIWVAQSNPRKYHYQNRRQKRLPLLEKQNKERIISGRSCSLLLPLSKKLLYIDVDLLYLRLCTLKEVEFNRNACMVTGRWARTCYTSCARAYNPLFLSNEVTPEASLWH